MKKIIFASCVAALFASLTLSQAQQSTIIQWNFEGLPIGTTLNPAPSINHSAGAESAASIGMQLFNGSTTNAPDILLGVTGDTGSDTITNVTQVWRIRGASGNGWTSTAGVGTQGAQFNVDTTGYTNITVSFDWYLTTQGEGHLQVEYTDDGINWTNVPVTVPAAQLGTFIAITNNTSALDPSSVQGYYVSCLSSSLGQEWFTNLTATISDPLAANNPNFGIRLVNASTGASCVNSKGAALNNSSGNWRFDNINIAGASLPKPFVAWTFDNLLVAVNLNPAPSLNNSLGAVSAACLGMQLFGGGCTNNPDVLAGASGDTGSDGITNYTLIFRARGNPGNGWTSTAPIGTQGVQFNADTTGQTNISVAFDWYLTTQGEGNLQLQYTVDGINWSNIPVTIPAAQKGIYIDNADNTSGSDPNSDQGYYVTNIPSSLHQEWFTNLTAVITDPLAANNPHFGIRMVNASTGISCVNSENQPLNNSSGNWRFDNIIFYAVANGSAAATPPVITASTNATVDGPFTNTFTDIPSWRANISSVKIGGVTLTNTAYAISAGKIVYTPANSTLLQKAGTVNISFTATNFALDLVSQPINAGVPAKLSVSQEPTGPTGNGGTLVVQPKLEAFDQYGNIAGAGSATYTATASAGWSFGTGSVAVQLLTNGVCNFTNLSAISGGSVSGATITFTASGASGLGGLPFTTTNSTAFNIPAPATGGFAPGNIVVEQLDANSANTTFSMLELNPTIANQAAPVNTFPIPATQTNGLRNSNSGSTGRLANSQDGTLLLFTAGQWSDSTLGDVTTVDLRGCGSFNSFGNYTLQTSYTGLGDATANQARSATTIDDVTFWMGDKGGVYTNNNTPLNAYIEYTVGNEANVRSLKAYDGSVYALQQEGGSDPQATVMAIVSPPSSGVAELQELEGFPIDGSVLDFSAVASGAHGTNIDVIYYIDGTNATSGSLFKFTNSFTIDNNTGDQIWANTGGSIGANWQTANGGDGIAVRTNASGGFDLFYTTGNGSTAGNQVVMVHDSGAWNQPINLTVTNVLYNGHGSTILKGIAFAPVTVTNGIVIYPIGKLGGTSYALGGGGSKSFSFSFTSGIGGSGSFSVWSSTNVTLPFNQWKALGHPVETPPGTYSFTDSTGATNPYTFYRVTSP
jgi:hypothetical protein